jgi:hypothetical protein
MANIRPIRSPWLKGEEKQKKPCEMLADRKYSTWAYVCAYLKKVATVKQKQIHPGARCQVPGARCQVPGARCQVPGARCQVPGARCQVPGVNPTSVSYKASVVQIYVELPTYVLRFKNKNVFFYCLSKVVGFAPGLEPTILRECVSPSDFDHLIWWFIFKLSNLKIIVDN